MSTTINGIDPTQHENSLQKRRAARRRLALAYLIFIGISILSLSGYYFIGAGLGWVVSAIWLVVEMGRSAVAAKRKVWFWIGLTIILGPLGLLFGPPMAFHVLGWAPETDPGAMATSA
ncbi:hypothetical protein IB278_33485 [Variovorax sp. VRV01]|uniref:hypothetical protein n=1 Tax=Variovorax sp. VRV01 TaxID=2769259 RepID=UPI001780490B|nr:hypothetical protein [Variovorax sp. VRV01]MBD9668878.1 hypothetical protein [Variovorax sp. VRV01]